MAPTLRKAGGRGPLGELGSPQWPQLAVRRWHTTAWRIAVGDPAQRAQGAHVVGDGEGELGGARVGMAGAPFGSGMRL